MTLPPATKMMRRTFTAGVALLLIPTLTVRAAEPSSEQAASTEVRQVVAYMLDTHSLSTATTTLVTDALTKESAESAEAAEVERMFPGFNGHVQRLVAQDVRSTVSRRIPDLSRQYEAVLLARLTHDDIRAMLAFQRDPISAQLRDPAFIESLKRADSAGAGLAPQMLANMTAQQRAFAARFLQSPSGRKFVKLAPELEALKYQWVQSVINDVARRMPAIGDAVLRQYDRAISR